MKAKSSGAGTLGLDPDQLVPEFVRRLLLIGDLPPGFNNRFSRGIEEVWAAADASFEAGRFDPHHFDCILINIAADSSEYLHRVLAALAPYLAENGYIGIIAACEPQSVYLNGLNSGFWDGLDLLCYQLLPEDKVPTAGLTALVAVRRNYNPVDHARTLAAGGYFNASIDILDRIPPELAGADPVLALLAAEKQRYYLDWQRSLPPDVPCHKLFFPFNREFAQVTSIQPHWVASYRMLADFYRHMGDETMAARVLRSIRQFAAADETDVQPPFRQKREPDDHDSETAPQWTGARRLPRLLILTHDHSDYGMDTLFHGLCRVLGDENVTEFPWKPALHGQNPAAANNYPCTFKHPAGPKTADQIVEELAGGRYDVIIYADVVQMAYPEEIRRIMDAGRNLPVILYDSWDNCYTPMDLILQYTGRKAVDLYLKREILSAVDYGSRAFPLPFSYPDERIPNRGVKKGENDVFWAGKRVWGLRPLYLDRIEKLLGRTFKATYPQAEYTELLQKSLIGLSFFGSGFDTVRYWEIPAHGVMLLAERPPIEIPHNFIDGQTAVFFDDLPELEEKLLYYLAHPAKAEEIAAAGQRHFRKFHTTTARAGQLLGYLKNSSAASEIYSHPESRDLYPRTFANSAGRR